MGQAERGTCFFRHRPIARPRHDTPISIILSEPSEFVARRSCAQQSMQTRVELTSIFALYRSELRKASGREARPPVRPAPGLVLATRPFSSATNQPCHPEPPRRGTPSRRQARWGRRSEGSAVVFRMLLVPGGSSPNFVSFVQKATAHELPRTLARPCAPHPVERRFAGDPGSPRTDRPIPGPRPCRRPRRRHGRHGLNFAFSGPRASHAKNTGFPKGKPVLSRVHA